MRRSLPSHRRAWQYCANRVLVPGPDSVADTCERGYWFGVAVVLTVSGLAEGIFAGLARCLALLSLLLVLIGHIDGLTVDTSGRPDVGMVRGMVLEKQVAEGK